MTCTSCNGPLAVLPSGSLARCGSCGGYFGVTPNGPLALALTAPWPTRSRDEVEDEAEDRAFDVQAAAPPGGPLKLLKFIIPAVVLVVMIVVALTVFSGMQSDGPAAAAPDQAKTKGKTTVSTPPAKKK